MNDKLRKLNELLCNFDKVYQNWQPILIGNSERNIIDRQKGISVIWQYYEVLGLNCCFTDNDILAAKQHFYTCGMLDVVGISQYDSPILDYGINHLSYALLSDCGPLIQRYATVGHSHYERTIEMGNSTACYVLQCLIKEDWAGYERGMDLMRTKALKKYPNMHLDISLYESIAEKDKAKAEAVLAEFVSPKVHKQRNKHHILLNEFISHPAIGYAKLAWLKGLEVRVDSPLVPAALLPVQPLAEYKNEYAFLSGVL
jgi:Immunity protein 49